MVIAVHRHVDSRRQINLDTYGAGGGVKVGNCVGAAEVGLVPPGTVVDAANGVGVVGNEGSRIRLPTVRIMLSRQLTSIIRSTVVPVLSAMVDRLSPEPMVYRIHLPGFWIWQTGSAVGDGGSVGAAVGAATVGVAVGVSVAVGVEVGELLSGAAIVGVGSKLL